MKLSYSVILLLGIFSYVNGQYLFTDISNAAPAFDSLVEVGNADCNEDNADLKAIWESHYGAPSCSAYGQTGDACYKTHSKTNMVENMGGGTNGACNYVNSKFSRGCFMYQLTEDSTRVDIIYVPADCSNMGATNNWGDTVVQVETTELCTTPTSTSGYDSITETNVEYDTMVFNVAVDCASGYSGQAAATICTNAGYPYILSGCTPDECTEPDTTGYDVSSVILVMSTFPHTVSCDTGNNYVGSASIEVCNPKDTPYTLSGCVPGADTSGVDSEAVFNSGNGAVCDGANIEDLNGADASQACASGYAVGGDSTDTSTDLSYFCDSNVVQSPGAIEGNVDSANARSIHDLATVFAYTYTSVPASYIVNTDDSVTADYTNGYCYKLYQKLADQTTFTVTSSTVVGGNDCSVAWYGGYCGGGYYDFGGSFPYPPLDLYSLSDTTTLLQNTISNFDISKLTITNWLAEPYVQEIAYRRITGQNFRGCVIQVYNQDTHSTENTALWYYAHKYSVNVLEFANDNAVTGKCQPNHQCIAFDPPAKCDPVNAILSADQILATSLTGAETCESGSTDFDSVTCTTTSIQTYETGNGAAAVYSCAGDGSVTENNACLRKAKILDSTSIAAVNLVGAAVELNSGNDVYCDTSTDALIDSNGNPATMSCKTGYYAADAGGNAIAESALAYNCVNYPLDGDEQWWVTTVSSGACLPIKLDLSNVDADAVNLNTDWSCEDGNINSALGTPATVSCISGYIPESGNGSPAYTCNQADGVVSTSDECKAHCGATLAGFTSLPTGTNSLVASYDTSGISCAALYKRPSTDVAEVVHAGRDCSASFGTLLGNIASPNADDQTRINECMELCLADPTCAPGGGSELFQVPKNGDDKCYRIAVGCNSYGNDIPTVLGIYDFASTFVGIQATNPACAAGAAPTLSGCVPIECNVVAQDGVDITGLAASYAIDNLPTDVSCNTTWYLGDVDATGCAVDGGDLLFQTCTLQSCTSPSLVYPFLEVSAELSLRDFNVELGCQANYHDNPNDPPTATICSSHGGQYVPSGNCASDICSENNLPAGYALASPRCNNCAWSSGFFSVDDDLVCIVDSVYTQVGNIGASACSEDGGAISADYTDGGCYRDLTHTLVGTNLTGDNALYQTPLDQLVCDQNGAVKSYIVAGANGGLSSVTALCDSGYSSPDGTVNGWDIYDVATNPNGENRLAPVLSCAGGVITYDNPCQPECAAPILKHLVTSGANDNSVKESDCGPPATGFNYKLFDHAAADINADAIHYSDNGWVLKTDVVNANTILTEAECQEVSDKLGLGTLNTQSGQFGCTTDESSYVSWVDIGSSAWINSGDGGKFIFKVSGAGDGSVGNTAAATSGSFAGKPPGCVKIGTSYFYNTDATQTQQCSAYFQCEQYKFPGYTWDMTKTISAVNGFIDFDVNAGDSNALDLPDCASTHHGVNNKGAASCSAPGKELVFSGCIKTQDCVVSNTILTQTCLCGGSQCKGGEDNYCTPDGCQKEKGCPSDFYNPVVEADVSGDSTATSHLDDGTGYANYAAFLAAVTLIDSEAACQALMNDTKAAVRALSGHEDFEYNSEVVLVVEADHTIYPGGCSVSIGNYHALYWNVVPEGQSGSVPSIGSEKLAVVSGPLPSTCTCGSENLVVGEFCHPATSGARAKATKIPCTVNGGTNAVDCLCPLSADKPVIDSALTCSLQNAGANGETDYEFCYNIIEADGVAENSNQECTNIRLNTPDSYLADDPGAVSVTNAEYWLVQRATCGPGKYNKLSPITDATNGGEQLAFSCETCSRDNFMVSFQNGFGLSIQNIGGVETFARDPVQDSNKGVVHGNCCINTHHSVCQAMMEEYKIKCESPDAAGDDGKGTGVQCLGDAETNFLCTGDAQGNACPAGTVPNGVTGDCSCV